MKYSTRDFGQVEVTDERVLEFVQPILGYEKYRRYTLLYDEQIGRKLIWLQSLEEPGLCFVLVDPVLLNREYQPRISLKDCEQLGEGEYLCLPIAVIPGDLRKATVNLKSPIVINTDNRRAMQVVLQQDYPVRTALFEEAQ